MVHDKEFGDDEDDMKTATMVILFLLAQTKILLYHAARLHA